MFSPMPLIAGAVVVLAVVGSVNAATMMRTKVMESISVSSNAEFSSNTEASVTGLLHSSLMRTKQIEQSSSFSAGYKQNRNNPKFWNAYWGGLEHTDDTNSTNVNRHNRPEWMKLQRCTQFQCEECSGTDLCWHGVEGKKLSRGAANIHTLQDQQNRFVNFTMIVHAKCADNAKMKFRVQNEGLEGGDLKFYWGMEEQNSSTSTWKTKLHANSDVGNKCMGMCGGFDANSDEVISIIWDKSFTQEDINELQIVWIPDPDQSSSNATVAVWLQDVTPAFTECQDEQVCLAMLDDKEGKQLRGYDVLMRQCLQDDLREYLNTTLRAKCEKWRDCLDKSPAQAKGKMLTLLKAAKVDEVKRLWSPPSVLIEVENTDEPGCLRPVFEDIPSWQCDCYEVMTAECNSTHGSMDLDKCLTMLACCSAKVCESWKTSANCSATTCPSASPSASPTSPSASLLLRNEPLPQCDDMPQCQSQSLIEQRGSAHQNNKQQDRALEERPSTLQSHTSPPEHNSASLQSLLEARKAGSATQQEDHRAFEESLSGKELC